MPMAVDYHADGRGFSRPISAESGKALSLSLENKQQYENIDNENVDNEEIDRISEPAGRGVSPLGARHQGACDRCGHAKAAGGRAGLL